MGRISGAIKEDALEHAADWHFSHENIVAANDRIVAVMDGLDLPEIYRRQEGRPTRPATAKNSRSRRTRSMPTDPTNISAMARASAPTPSSIAAVSYGTPRSSAPQNAKAPT